MPASAQPTKTCDLQLSELRAYAMRHGWEIAGEYVDTGWSGAKASRPEFDRLMADAAARMFDIVLCWKLDRFGRSLLNCKNALQQLQGHGVRFIATSQGIDTDESNPAARFLLHISSGDTSKPASRGHFKTGQLSASRTAIVLPYR